MRVQDTFFILFLCWLTVLFWHGTVFLLVKNLIQNYV